MAETQTVELVPQVPIDRLQTARADMDNLKLTLAQYESEAKALKVTNSDEFAAGAELLKKVRDNRIHGAWIMAPFKAIAKTITEKFRTMELEHSNKCEVIESLIEPKLNAQKRREADAAAAEQRRINEENRKQAEAIAEAERKAREEAAEVARKEEAKRIAAAKRAGEISASEAAIQREKAKQQEQEAKAQAEEDARKVAANVQEIEVLPSTPKVSGLRQRVNYYAEMKNFAQFMLAYEKADVTTRAFLVRFIQPDQKAIGAYAREVKGDEAVMKRLPGVRAWHEDSI